MTSSSKPACAPLTLPPAILHTAPPEPHVDSDEFRQRDKHRTSRELVPIYRPKSTERCPLAQRCSPNTFQAGCPHTASSCASVCTTEEEDLSNITTAPDSEGPDLHHEQRIRLRLRRQTPRWYDPVVKFWTAQVSITIDEGQHRDHLALERTFLAYLRTSLAFAMAGVIIAQLYRLQHASKPNPNLGFFVLGVPLAAIFISFGLFVLLIGAVRFWRQQSAITRGKVRAGGWDIMGVMVGSVVLVAVAFALVAIIDIQRSY